MEGLKKVKDWWLSWEGLSASTIKMIAVISMLIDHIGAGILGRYLSHFGIREAFLSGNQTIVDAWMQQYGDLYLLYRILRGIGRLAFPIYCFFLAEGLKYTSNAWKYLGRLTVFALLSEIPFDLLFHSSVLEFGGQNVFFTLAIGLAVMMAMRALDHCLPQKWMAVVPDILIVTTGCLLAEWMKTDYASTGILCLVVIYLFSNYRGTRLVAGALAFLWEWPMAPLAFLPLALYKKKRGWRGKYFFYAFYPAHLLILYLITLLLGIWEFSAL